MFRYNLNVVFKRRSMPLRLIFNKTVYKCNWCLYTIEAELRSSNISETENGNLLFFIVHLYIYGTMVAGLLAGALRWYEPREPYELPHLAPPQICSAKT